jgi:hypothetical protein
MNASAAKGYGYNPGKVGSMVFKIGFEAERAVDQLTAV